MIDAADMLVRCACGPRFPTATRAFPVRTRRPATRCPDRCPHFPRSLRSLMGKKRYRLRSDVRLLCSTNDQAPRKNMSSIEKKRSSGDADSHDEDPLLTKRQAGELVSRDTRSISRWEREGHLTRYGQD